MKEASEWSELEVAEIQEKSTLITLKNLQPLKILNPGTHSGSCHAVLSTYGGGMVSGDKIRLRVACGRNTRLFLGTQSNTKVFRSSDGAAAEQFIVGELEEKSLAVVFPDPVVLQEDSRYRQVQHWHLKPDALLFVVDWFHSGRMDRGEKFVFTSFLSELKVSIAGKVVLLDRFAFSPAENIAASPANFDRYQTMFSAYLVGNPEEERFIRLAEKLLQLKMAEGASPHFDLAQQAVILSASRVKEGVYILRAMAESRIDLLALCDALLTELATDSYLGFHPWKRKY
ncbi:hypothetical protein GCM10023188_16890 [Pontibacter saemangeumensis]|uniref:Urease accessory protein UreD n=1 Tax=Pontibacter saemangeumensis TaxID=1084525 RepID=A0ABP8LIJ3_9BACT